MRRLLLILLAPFCAMPAFASVLFDGANDQLRGTLASQYGEPMTLACKIKIADHPAADTTVIQIGAANNSQNDSYKGRTTATDNQLATTSIDSGGTATSATVTQFTDNTWISVIFTINNDDGTAGGNARVVRVEASGGNNDTTRTVAGTLDDIAIGENLADGLDFAGRIAECAIWDVDLATADEDAYVANNCTANIDPTNLIAYWPLIDDADDFANDGVDTGGDLTASGNAAIDADHPTMGSCSTTPAWDTPPSVSSQTDTAYTISYDADANADNIYCGLFAKDATTPTGAAIEAGTGDRVAATEAATGSADTIVLTAPESPPWYIGDIYCVLEGSTPGDYTAVSEGDLLDEVLDIPSGKQRLTLTSVDSTSPYFGQGVAASDTCTIDLLTDPGAYVITDELDGTVSYAAGGDTSRQLIDSYCYDVSSPANLVFVLVYNNQPPAVGENWPFLEGSLFEIGADPDIDLNDSVTDAELDDIDWTIESGTDPTDWVLDAETGIYSDGSPGACGTLTWEIGATDAYGALSTIGAEAIIGPLVPASTGDDEATYVAEVEALCSLTATAGTPMYSSTVPLGDVVSTSPEAGTLVEPDETVIYYLSLGPYQGRKNRNRLGLGVN